MQSTIFRATGTVPATTPCVMKKSSSKTPGNPRTHHDGLQNQGTDQGSGTQAGDIENAGNTGDFGERGTPGAKGQPSATNSGAEPPDRQDGAHWEQANDSAGGSTTPIPGPGTK